MLLLGAAVLAGLTSGAHAASAATKPYTATVSPASALAGSRTVFTAVLSNPADAQQQLGAAQLTAPAGLRLVASSLSYDGPGVASVSGNVIEVNYAAVQPGESLTLSVKADVPCSSTRSLEWSVRAKQANEFNGAGNDLDLVGDSPATTIDGACRLQFVEQPANARVGGYITASAYSSSGPPVSVEVVGSTGARVTDSAASITLATASGPASATLGGTTTVTAALGLALFSDLTLDTPGSYTLQATSPGLISAMSTPFRIDTVVAACLENLTCTATTATTITTVGVTSSPSKTLPDFGFLTLSMEAGPGIDCAGYEEMTPDTVLVDITSLARTKTATLTIDKTQMRYDTNNGASFLQFCFGSPVPFVTASGLMSTADGTFDWDTDGDADPVYEGLLPTCSSRVAAPCVTSRKKTGAGDGVIAANLPAGDPRMRG